MTKYDLNFVKNNGKEITIRSYENAEKHKKSAELLASIGNYSHAFFHIITALEELIKVGYIASGSINDRHLKEVINHNKKAGKIYALSAAIYDIQNKKMGINWAEKRYPELRENALYVSLSKSRNGHIYPQDTYYQKRFNAFIKLYNDIVNTYLYKEFLKNI